MNRKRLGAAALAAALAAARLSAAEPGPADSGRPAEDAPHRASISVGFQYGFLSDPIGSPSPYAYPPGIGARMEYAPPWVLGYWEPFLAADLRYHAAVSLEPGYFGGTRFLLPGIYFGAQRRIAAFEDGRVFALAARLGYTHYIREHVFLGTTYTGSRPALSLEGSLRAGGPGPLRASFGLALDLVLDARPYLVPGIVAGLDFRRELPRHDH